MSEIRKEAREQRSQIKTVVEEMQRMSIDTAEQNRNFKKDMKDLNKDINDKLAMLKKRTDALPAAGAPSAATYSAAAASDLPRPWSEGPLLAAPTRGPGEHPYRLWLKGFRDTLTTKQLVHFATTQVLTKLPPTLQAGAVARAPGFGAAVYIDFAATTDMKDAKNQVNAMKLTYTNSENNTVDIRASGDISLKVRYKNKFVGEVWSRLRKHLEEQPNFGPFQIAQSSGKMFVLKNEKPTEVFKVVYDEKGAMTLEPKTANLVTMGVDDQLAAKWISLAADAAARLAPRQ
jgi:hypothetical protein